MVSEPCASIDPLGLRIGCRCKFSTRIDSLARRECLWRCARDKRRDALRGDNGFLSAKLSEVLLESLVGDSNVGDSISPEYSVLVALPPLLLALAPVAPLVTVSLCSGATLTREPFRWPTTEFLRECFKPLNRFEKLNPFPDAFFPDFFRFLLMNLNAMPRLSRTPSPSVLRVTMRMLASATMSNEKKIELKISKWRKKRVGRDSGDHPHDGL
jgi:hypothetical protein